MIYITGDCHADFKRFTKKKRLQNKLNFTENDYIIVCGDFGLLWARDKELAYNLEWLGNLPFKILWVQGNHENYDLIKEFPLEEWNGGKVRHIVKEKIILLERGQVFSIEGKTFFTFGGASSNDITGGILDRNDPDFRQKYEEAKLRKKPYRILHEEWWPEELPSKEELEEGIQNLMKCNFKVDYVISHCAANRVQDMLKNYYSKEYPTNLLTNYFEELEQKLEYKHWYCGHYHEDIEIDEKHSILYNRFVSD